ncbi:MAG: aldehyde dehydrogenase family protein [Sphingomonadaceae bacterium]
MTEIATLAHHVGGRAREGEAGFEQRNPARPDDLLFRGLDADLGIAVDCAVNGALFAVGQRCTATSRIIVENSIADQFAAALQERAATLRIGDPSGRETQIGPLASPRQKARVVEQVSAAEAEGLVPVMGGTQAEMPHSFFTPALFVHVPEDSLLAREEIFWPRRRAFRGGEL